MLTQPKPSRTIAINNEPWDNGFALQLDRKLVARNLIK